MTRFRSIFLIPIFLFLTTPLALGKGDFRKATGPVGIEAQVLDPVLPGKTVRIHVTVWVNDELSEKLSVKIRPSPGLSGKHLGPKIFKGKIEPHVKKVMIFKIKIANDFLSGRVLVDATRTLGGVDENQSIAVPLSSKR